MVLKENLISLKMYHQASIDCFRKKVVFWKLEFPKLEFDGDRRILPTCVILTLEAKRLLHKGCEAYLEHVVDKSTPKVCLQCKNSRMCFLKIYQVYHLIKN